MTDVRPMLDAIDRLYAAVLTPADWSAAVESVTDLLQAEHAIVCVPGGADGSGAFATVRMDAAHAALISSAEAARLGSRMISEIPIGLAISWPAIIADRDWEKSPLYNEIIRPANGFYSVNALVDVPGGEMTGFNFCRPRKAGPFDLGEVDMLQSLLPHFTNVLELRRRLGAAFRENNDLLQVLERMDTGVILTDAASRPSFANGRALGIVAQADGLSLAAGRLSAAVSAATQRLRQAIAAASTHVPTAFPSGAGPGLKLRLKRPSGRPPLLLWLFPIQPLGQPLGQPGSVGSGRSRAAHRDLHHRTGRRSADRPRRHRRRLRAHAARGGHCGAAGRRPRPGRRRTGARHRHRHGALSPQARAGQDEHAQPGHPGGHAARLPRAAQQVAGRRPGISLTWPLPFGRWFSARAQPRSPWTGRPWAMRHARSVAWRRTT